MKLRNVSNYPQIVKGVRIEPEEVEEVNVGAARMQKLESDSRFETVEEDDNQSDGDAEETSKSEQNQEGEE